MDPIVGQASDPTSALSSNESGSPERSSSSAMSAQLTRLWVDVGDGAVVLPSLSALLDVRSIAASPPLSLASAQIARLPVDGALVLSLAARSTASPSNRSSNWARGNLTGRGLLV